VWYYDLYREQPDGRHEAIGRIFDDVHYVKALARTGSNAAPDLRLVAVAPDGSRSAPAVVEVPWT
jgi:hypothetical protein